MMNSLLEKVCAIEKWLQTSTTAEESNVMVEHALTTKPQSLAIEITSSKISGPKKAKKTTENTPVVFLVEGLAI